MNEEKDTCTEREAIDALIVALLDTQRQLEVARADSKNEELAAAEAALGVCHFKAGLKNGCLNMTKSGCDAVGGSWSSGAKCAPKPGPGQCQAGTF